MAETDSTSNPLQELAKAAVDAGVPPEAMVQLQERQSKLEAQLYDELDIDRLMTTFEEARANALHMPSAAERQEALSEEDFLKRREFPDSVTVVVPFHAAGKGMSPEEFRSKASIAGISLDHIEDSIGRIGLTPTEYKARASEAASQAGFDPTISVKQRGALIRAIGAETARAETGNYPDWYNKDAEPKINITPLEAGLYGSAHGLINARDEIPEVEKSGSAAFSAFLQTAEAEMTEDTEMAQLIPKWGTEEQGYQKAVKYHADKAIKAARQKNPNITASEQEAIIAREEMRTLASVALWKTVGLWTHPIFVNYEFDERSGQPRLKRVEDVTWRKPLEAGRTIISPTIEIVGMRRNKITDEDEIMARQIGATQTVFDLMDIAKSGLMGVAAQVAPGWLAPAGGPTRDEGVVDAALRGAASRRNALEYMWDSELYQKGPAGKVAASLIGGGLEIFLPDITTGFGLAVPLAKRAEFTRNFFKVKKALPEIDHLLETMEGHAEAAALVRQGNIPEAIALTGGAPTKAEQKLRKIDVADVVGPELARNDARVATVFARENPDIGSPNQLGSVKAAEEIHNALPKDLKNKPHVHPSVRKDLQPQIDYQELYGFDKILYKLQKAKENIIAEMAPKIKDLETTVLAHALDDIRGALKGTKIKAADQDKLNDWVRININQAFTNPRKFVSDGEDFALSLIGEGADAAKIKAAVQKISRRPLTHAEVEAPSAALEAIERAFLAVATNMEARAFAANRTREKILAQHGKVFKQTLPVLAKKAEELSMLSERGIAFSNRLQTVFGKTISKEQANRVARIIDAVAEIWGARKGRDASAFWVQQGFGVDYGPGSKYPAPVVPRQTKPIQAANTRLQQGAGKDYQLVEVARAKDNSPMYKIQGPDGRIYGTGRGGKDPERTIDTFLAGRSQKNRHTIPVGDTLTDQGLGAEALDQGLQGVLGSKMEGTTGQVIDFLIKNAELPSTKAILTRLKKIKEVWASIESVPFRVVDAGRGGTLPSETTLGIVKPRADYVAESIEIRGRGFSLSGLSEETLTHEILHAATLSRLWQAFNAGADTHLGKIFIDFEGLQESILTAINSSLKRTTDTARKQQLERWKNLVSAGNIDEVAKISPIERFEAIAEIITYAFTDPDFQKLLKSYKAPELRPGGLERSLLTKLFEAIRDLFGFKVAEGSSLARVIMLSDELLVADVSETVRYAPGSALDRNLLFHDPDPRALRHEASAAGAKTADEIAEARRLWEEEGIESPYFKRWSGGAPVIKAGDELPDGPVVVEAFHGTTEMPGAEVLAFTRKQPHELGYHFGTSEAASGRLRLLHTDEMAKLSDADRLEYAQAIRPGVGIIPVYLSVNPLRVQDWVSWKASEVLADLKRRHPQFNDVFEDAESQVKRTSDLVEQAEIVRNAVRQTGHDGLVYRNVTEGDPADSYIAFEPTQIKSKFNRGTFDPAGPRILRHEVAPDAKQAVDEPIFYSRLEKVVEEKMPDTLSATPPREQVIYEASPERQVTWTDKKTGESRVKVIPARERKVKVIPGETLKQTVLRSLRGTGVKAEEISATNVEEFIDDLAAQNVPTVTKQELLDHLRNNRTTVNEFLAGSASPEVVAAQRGADEAWTELFQVKGGAQWSLTKDLQSLGIRTTGDLHRLSKDPDLIHEHWMGQTQTAMEALDSARQGIFGDVDDVTQRIIDQVSKNLWKGTSSWGVLASSAEDILSLSQGIPELVSILAGHNARMTRAETAAHRRVTDSLAMRDSAGAQRERKILHNLLATKDARQESLEALKLLSNNVDLLRHALAIEQLPEWQRWKALRGEVAKHLEDSPLVQWEYFGQNRLTLGEKGDNYREILVTLSPRIDATELSLEEGEALVSSLLKSYVPSVGVVTGQAFRDTPPTPSASYRDHAGQWYDISSRHIRQDGQSTALVQLRRDQTGFGTEGPLPLFRVDDPKAVSAEEKLPFLIRAEDAETAKMIAARDGMGAGAFEGPHWTQPNVLVHIRATDRVDAAGRKILYVEEIQSDWHEIGRVRGYTVEENAAKLEAATEDLRRAAADWDIWDKGEVDTPRGVIPVTGEEPDVASVRSRIRQINKGPVPPAPFKDTKAWTSLAVKRILRMAADEDYDGVAFARADFDLRLDEAMSTYWQNIGMPRAARKEYYDVILPSVLKERTGLKTLPTVDIDDTKRLPFVELTDDVVQRVGAPQPLFHKVVLPDDTTVKQADVQFAADGQSLILALKEPNVASALYSVGRILRRVLDDKDDIALLLSWIRTQSDDFANIRLEGNRFVGVSDEVAEAAEETFAEAFVKYVMKEEAPTTELEDAFRLLRSTLRAVYARVRPDKDVEISDDVKAVFDRLLLEPPKPNKRFPTAMKVTLNQLLGTPEKREIVLFDEIAKEAERLGIAGTTAESLKREFDATGRLVFDKPLMPERRAFFREIKDANGIGTGKYEINKAQLTALQLELEQEQLIVKGMAKPVAGLSEAQNAFNELQPTEMMRQWGKSSLGAKFAIGVLFGFGGDYNAVLRNFSPVVRDTIKASSRLVGEVIGDAATLGIEDTSPLLKRKGNILQRLGEYLGGARLRFEEGRHIVTSGYDYFDLAGESLRRAWLELGVTDNGKVTRNEITKVADLVDTLRYGDDVERYDRLAWYEGLEAAFKGKNTAFTDLMKLFFATDSGIAGLAAGLHNAAGAREMSNPVKRAKLLEMITYYNGLSKRFVTNASGQRIAIHPGDRRQLVLSGDPKKKKLYELEEVSGTSVERSQKFLEEFRDLFDDPQIGDFRSRHAAVIIAAQGGAARARSMLSGVDIIVDQALYRAVEAWRSGGAIKEEMYPRLEVFLQKIGIRPELETVDTILDQKLYMPTEVRKQLAEAIQKSHIRPAKEWDSWNRRGWMFWNFIKTQLIRGSLSPKKRYFFMNTLDTYVQLAIVTGLLPATQHAIRQSFQNVLIFVPALGRGTWMLQRLEAFDPLLAKAGAPAVGAAAKKLVDKIPFIRKGLHPHAQELIREQLQDTADWFIRTLRKATRDRGDALEAVQDWLGQARYDIRINPIMRGDDELIQIGGKLYRPRDVRDIATQEGIFASFQTRALERNFRKANVESLQRAIELYEGEEGIGSFIRRGSSTATDLLDDIFKMTSDIAETWAERERLGAMVTLMEFGYDPRTAAKIAVEGLFDYAGTMTKNDKHWVINMVLPFWAYEKNARALIFNQLFSPWGAYRIGVLRRSFDVGSDALSWLLYDYAVDPYGIDTRDMPDDILQSYYTWRDFIEMGVGRPLEELPEDFKKQILITFDVPSLADLPPDTRQFLENGYGGPEGVPKNTKIAFRMMFTGTSMVVADGKVMSLDAMLHDSYLSIVSRFLIPPADQTKLRSYYRDRPRVTIPQARTEEVRRWASLVNQVDPNYTWMDIFIPESTIQAGMSGLVNHLAFSTLLLFVGVDKAVTHLDPDNAFTQTHFGLSAEHTYDKATKKAFSDLFPIERAILREPISGVLALEEGSPAAIHPSLAPYFLQFFPVQLITVDAVIDPYREAEDRRMGMSDDEARRSAQISPQRLYVPYGAFSFIFRSTPGLREWNESLFLMDVIEMPEATKQQHAALFIATVFGLKADFVKESDIFRETVTGTKRDYEPPR